MGADDDSHCDIHVSLHKTSPSYYVGTGSPIEIFFVIRWHDPDGLTRGCLSPCSRTGRGSVTDLYKQKHSLRKLQVVIQI